MPLKINVGISRKIGEENYGSKGANINIEMELDGSLANDPGKLQGRIRQMFDLVRESVGEELNGTGEASATAKESHTTTNGNGHNGSSSQPSKSARQATESQVKAIFAITKSKGLNLTTLLRQHFNVARPDDLSIKQASQFIDQLKNGASS
jgi:hypothetical protein